MVECQEELNNDWLSLIQKMKGQGLLRKSTVEKKPEQLQEMSG
jgi:hypothetical protein